MVIRDGQILTILLGGKVEPGETTIQAAKRELEVNLSINPPCHHDVDLPLT